MAKRKYLDEVPTRNDIYQHNQTGEHFIQLDNGQFVPLYINEQGGLSRKDTKQQVSDSSLLDEFVVNGIRGGKSAVYPQDKTIVNNVPNHTPNAELNRSTPRVSGESYNNPLALAAGAVPFAVAAYPALAGAGELGYGAIAGSEALSPYITALTNPYVNTALMAEGAAYGLDNILKDKVFKGDIETNVNTTLGLLPMLGMTGEGMRYGKELASTIGNVSNKFKNWYNKQALNAVINHSPRLARKTRFIDSLDPRTIFAAAVDANRAKKAYNNFKKVIESNKLNKINELEQPYEIKIPKWLQKYISTDADISLQSEYKFTHPLTGQTYTQNVTNLNKTPQTPIDVSKFTLDPYSREIKINLGGKTVTLSRTENSEDYQRAINDYIDSFNTELGEDGYIAGSTLLYGKLGLPGTPGDTEIITTASRKANVDKKLGTITTKQGFAYTGRSDKAINKSVDIDVIEETDEGNAVGALAHQIYSTLYPEEYAALHRQNALSDNPIESYKLPLPIKAEDLLQEVIKNPEAAVNITINDFLRSYKPKHNQRALNSFVLPDEALDKVINQQIKLGKAFVGKNYKSVKQMFPNMKYDDVEANKNVLKRLNLPEELANNPKAMEAVIEKFAFEDLSTRRINRRDLLEGTSIEEAITSNYSPNRAYGSGFGGNTVRTSNTGGGTGYGDNLGILWHDRSKYADKVNNVEDYFKLLDKEKYNAVFSQEEIKFLEELTGKKIEDMNALESYLRIKNDPSEIQAISDATGIKSIRTTSTWRGSGNARSIDFPYKGNLDRNAIAGHFYNINDSNSPIELSGALYNASQRDGVENIFDLRHKIWNNLPYSTIYRNNVDDYFKAIFDSNADRITRINKLKDYLFYMNHYSSKSPKGSRAFKDNTEQLYDNVKNNLTGPAIVLSTAGIPFGVAYYFKTHPRNREDNNKTNKKTNSKTNKKAFGGRIFLDEM